MLMRNLFIQKMNLKRYEKIGKIKSSFLKDTNLKKKGIKEMHKEN